MNARPLAIFRNSTGFTLVELIMVVVVIGALVAIAAPSFSAMAANTRLKGAASDLHMSLLKARSEAVKRNNSVRVVRVSSNWGGGWNIVLVSDSSVLGTEAEKTGVTISSKPNCGSESAIANVTYLRSGRIAGAARPCFEVSAAKTTQKRCVSVEISGIPKVSTAACT